MVDDDVVMNLARAMPKLESLQLGNPPCSEIPTGVTSNGFVVLANHCPDLRTLCVHFQVATLSVPPPIDGMTSDVRPAALRRDCALIDLLVGDVSVADESVLAVTQTLVRIFPHKNVHDPHRLELGENPGRNLRLQEKWTVTLVRNTSAHVEVTLVTSLETTLEDNR